MADSFKGNQYVTLRPGASVKPLWMKFKPASASTANDGSIPYGSTLHDFTVQIKDAITQTTTTQLHSSVSKTSNVGVVYVQHSTSVSTGLYHVVATATVALSGTTQRMVEVFDFERLYVVSE